MSEMVLRVAAMLESKRNAEIDRDAREFTSEEWQLLARAAIRAIREPTERMRDMGTLALMPDGSVSNREADYVWHSMIDAALSD